MFSMFWSIRRIALFLAIALVAACDGGAPTAATGEARVTLRLLTSATVRTVILEISGPGLAPAMVVNIPVGTDSTAVDTLTIPAGSGRRFTATAVDTAGVVTHRADTTLTLLGGTNAPLLLRLIPLDADFGVTVTFAGASVTVPDTTTRVMQAGDTLRIEATGRAATGAVVATDALTWGATNPAILTVAGGLVTARRPGIGAVVVSYRGATVRIPVSVAGTLPGSSGFSRAPNGVSILCPTAAVGSTGVVNGVTYTKRNRAGLDSLIAANNFAPLETTCTSGITNMSLLFFQISGFNTPIGSWDVSTVVDMSAMFRSASTFNQALANWDVGAVTSMYEMFFDASAFNQPLGSWNVSRVTNMVAMFRGTPFNHPIASWNTGNVVDMRLMFSSSVFNQPIGNWNVSNVTTMAGMFNLSAFNQPLGGWDISRVTDTGGMFALAQFNQSLASWDVSNVTTMANMFGGAVSFNQPIGNWNVSAVTEMSEMFRDALAFNQDLSGWCVSSFAAAAPRFSENTGAWTRPKPVWGSCSPVSTQQSTVTATPTALTANGASASTVTVRLKRFDGSDLTTSAGALAFETPTLGTISAVTDNNNGTYNVTYTAGTSAGSVTLRPRINGGLKALATVTLTLTVPGSGFYLAPNNVTVMCPLAAVGSTGVVGGVTYTKRNRAGLDSLIAANDFAPLETTCTSGITNMDGLFFRRSGFNVPIGSWDVSQVVNMDSMFRETAFNQPIGYWDVSRVETMGAMFLFTSFNQPIGDWDVSNVVNMGGIFGYSPFNQPIGDWDVSNVNNMGGMFSHAQSFNQPIGNWNTGRVTSMDFMFYRARAFNQPIGAWNVSAVTRMNEMFTEAVAFNEPIGAWDVSRVTDMQNMFRASSFNQPIGAWNTGAVASMAGMFLGAAFNQPIGNWNVSNVSDMSVMFHLASAFNQPIGNWNTAKVVKMDAMFHSAPAFNQPIGSWNVSTVTTMNNMFVAANSFNQDLAGWNVRNVSNMIGMFEGATVFNRNLSGWCVPSIPTEPVRFAGGAGAWTLPKPVWGTCPTP